MIALSLTCPSLLFVLDTTSVPLPRVALPVAGREVQVPHDALLGHLGEATTGHKDQHFALPGLGTDPLAGIGDQAPCHMLLCCLGEVSADWGDHHCALPGDQHHVRPDPGGCLHRRL